MKLTNYLVISGLICLFCISAFRILEISSGSEKYVYELVELEDTEENETKDSEIELDDWISSAADRILLENNSTLESYTDLLQFLKESPGYFKIVPPPPDCV